MTDDQLEILISDYYPNLDVKAFKLACISFAKDYFGPQNDDWNNCPYIDELALAISSYVDKEIKIVE